MRCASPNAVCTINGRPWCLNTRTSVLACGGCNRTCRTDQVCVSGQCRDYDPGPIGCAACPCAMPACPGGAACCSAPDNTAPVCVAGGACA